MLSQKRRLSGQRRQGPLVRRPGELGVQTQGRAGQKCISPNSVNVEKQSKRKRPASDPSPPLALPVWRPALSPSPSVLGMSVPCCSGPGSSGSDAGGSGPSRGRCLLSGEPWAWARPRLLLLTLSASSVSQGGLWAFPKEWGSREWGVTQLPAAGSTHLATGSHRVRQGRGTLVP